MVVPQARSYALGAIARAANHGRDGRGGHPRPGCHHDDGDPRCATPARRGRRPSCWFRSPTARSYAGSRSRGAARSRRPGCCRATRARETYDRIVAQARDPALLEFAGFNLVRSSVFPVEPGGDQAVRLTYEHLLAVNGDRVDYVLPRSESVEYTVPWKIAVKITSDSADHGGLFAEPSAADRRARSRAWRPSSSRPRPGPSPARSGCRSCASAPTFRPRCSRTPTPRSAAATSCSWPACRPRPAKPDSAGLKREVTLVIDRSGSMRGEKLEQVREAALQVLAGLDDGEAFNIILYNEGVEPFADRPVRKSRATIKDATEFLEGMTARGGTNIHDALLEALRQPPADGTLPIVLFMTDGLPTVGQTSEAAIRELARKGNPHQRRIFTFGVGVDVNTPLLEKIAYESRATTTFVLPGEDVEVKVAAVFQRLRGPGAGRSDARDRRERDTPARAGADPGRLPDLFEGDQIVLLGQYIGEEPLEFTLRGNYRGTPRVFQFRLSLDQATTRNGFVPRLWASRKIGLLVDAIREQGGTAGRRLPRGQGDHQPGDPRAGRRDRAALDRVRHPHRVHRLPGTRGDRLLAEGQGASPRPRTCSATGRSRPAAGSRRSIKI